MIPRYVPKAWGYEAILIATDHYTFKRMTALPGFRCSLHRHAEKDETFLVSSGRLLLEVGDAHGGLRTHYLGAGCSERVLPGVLHRFAALDDVPCVFLEVSTFDDPADCERVTESEAWSGT